MLKKSWKLLLCMCLVLSTIYSGEVQAKEVGKIYKTSVTGYYYHPVTGEVADSASEENYSIGESMVKNLVQSAGQFEVADGGNIYFTFKLGMQNFSSSQSFQIQNKGSSGWSSVSATKTGSGSINSGTTTDFMVKAPSTSCVVKVSMYVEPMGRTVVFFLGHGGLTESTNTGMSATQVTTEVASTTTSDSTTSSTDSSSNNASTSTNTGTTNNSANTSTSTTTETNDTKDTLEEVEVEEQDEVDEQDDIDEQGEIEEQEQVEEDVEEIVEDTVGEVPVEEVDKSTTPWGALACALAAAVIGGVVAFKIKKAEPTVEELETSKEDMEEKEESEEIITEAKEQDVEDEEDN